MNEIEQLRTELDLLKAQNAAMREALQKAYHALQWSKPFSANACAGEVSQEQSEEWHEEACESILVAMDDKDAGNAK